MGLGARLLWTLDRTVEAVAVAAFLVMFAAALAQVLARYVLQIPLSGTEELSRIAFAAAMLLGIAAALRRDEHIRIDAVPERLPPRARAFVHLAFDLVVLAVVAVLLIGTFRMMGVTWNTRMVSLGWMRVGYLYAVQFAALWLMALYLAVRLPTRLAALVHGGRR